LPQIGRKLDQRSGGLWLGADLCLMAIVLASAIVTGIYSMLAPAVLGRWRSLRSGSA
jgi:hypothetical protein